MKIIINPATIHTIPAQTAFIRDDWSTAAAGYSFTDTGKEVVVTINPKAGTPAVAANPAANPPIVAASAVPPTTAFQFVLYAQGAPYAAANALNNGQGYGNADLIAAITAYLAKIAVAA